MLLAVVAAVWLWTPQAIVAPSPAGSTTSDGEVPRLTVHVSGAVVAPGLVELPMGARVADAVAAAGGTLRSADLANLNLAAPVHDGEQVHIASAAAAAGEAPVVVADGRIRINDADAAGLEALPGVGPVLAGRIVAFRDQHGPFATPEDLLDVPGIGEAKLAAMRDAIAVP